MRLSPPNYKRIVQTQSLDINFGGAEANTSVMLSNLGVDTKFVTALPRNSLGDAAINYLNSYGLNTEYINRCGERIGVYYFESGMSLRNSRVIYDRKNSAITNCDIENFDFNAIFEGATWFHFTGITAALGNQCLTVLKKAIEVAKNKGIKISVDLNYRKQLWAYDDFKKTMMPLLNDIELCIGWIDLDKKGEYKVLDASKNGLNDEYFSRVFTRMQDEFNIKYISTTLRETYDSSYNALTGIIYDGNSLYRSKRYEFDIIDRVGGGDAFAGGLIYKLIENTNINEVVEFATAASVLKHTILGDSNIVSKSEIMDLVNGASVGEVKR